MLKFFRSIRKRLVAQGKVKNYLLYAAGEILLVVVGILLALQVNNWNEAGKRQKLVSRITKTLNDETTANLKAIRTSNAYRKKLVRELKNDRHLINKMPLNALPFDATNDQQLTSFISADIAASGAFPGKIEVIRAGKNRFLKLGDRANRIVIENDTLKIFGTGNIQLKSADISNHTWTLAQASNAITDMDYDLVNLLGKLNVLHISYQSTAEKAVTILYTGEASVLSILEDMLWLERDLERIYEEILVAIDR